MVCIVLKRFSITLLLCPTLFHKQDHKGVKQKRIGDEKDHVQKAECHKGKDAQRQYGFVQIRLAEGQANGIEAVIQIGKKADDTARTQHLHKGVMVKIGIDLDQPILHDARILKACTKDGMLEKLADTKPPQIKSAVVAKSVEEYPFDHRHQLPPQNDHAAHAAKHNGKRDDTVDLFVLSEKADEQHTQGKRNCAKEHGSPAL